VEQEIGKLLEMLGMGSASAGAEGVYSGQGTGAQAANQDNYKKYQIEAMSQGQEPLPYEAWQQQRIQQAQALRGGGGQDMGMEGGY
jgi:hypothetical protein